MIADPTPSARTADRSAGVAVPRHPPDEPSELTFNGKAFEGALMGTMNRDGRYLELIEAIRLAIGDRLVEREDLGELDGAVRKMIAQQSGEKQK